MESWLHCALPLFNENPGSALLELSALRMNHHIIIQQHSGLERSTKYWTPQHRLSQWRKLKSDACMYTPVDFWVWSGGCTATNHTHPLLLWILPYLSRTIFSNKKRCSIYSSHHTHCTTCNQWSMDVRKCLMIIILCWAHKPKDSAAHENYCYMYCIHVALSLPWLSLKTELIWTS